MVLDLPICQCDSRSVAKQNVPEEVRALEAAGAPLSEIRRLRNDLAAAVTPTPEGDAAA